MQDTEDIASTTEWRSIESAYKRFSLIVLHFLSFLPIQLCQTQMLYSSSLIWFPTDKVQQ